MQPPPAGLDVVRYTSTASTTLIEADRVRDLVAGAARTHALTDSLTVTVAKCRFLGLAQISIVPPYIVTVAAPIRAASSA